MHEIQVLNIQRLSAADRAKIEAVDPAVRLTDAGGWFDGEYRETWPAYTAARYLATGATGSGTRADRDRLLAQTEIILGGWPFPLDLRARAPRLKWFHQRPAGASNLLRGDLWGSDVAVTTSRGAGNTLAMAEYAVAGMRVIGTRRQPQPGALLPTGFSHLGGAQELDQLLPESDFVVICCQWTPETTHLFNQDRFAAMKEGAILVNVARGEIIDEAALAEALLQGRLRGVVLDVYDGEFEQAPPGRLWQDERVLITPHVSGNSDESRHGAIDVFCDNLRAYLDGRPLRNVIDWERGY